MTSPFARHWPFFVASLTFACGGEIHQTPDEPAGELSGTIVRKTGSFSDPSSVRRMPVAANVRLYALQRAELALAIPNDPASPVLSSVTTSSDGHYRLRAPRGTYTLLVEFNRGVYPLENDGEWWNPVVIEPEVTRNIDIEINHVVD